MGPLLGVLLKVVLSLWDQVVVLGTPNPEFHLPIIPIGLRSSDCAHARF